MVENVSHIEFIGVAMALVGGWIKFQAEYNKLSARVKSLEMENGEFKADVRQMMKDIQEIKLLLAKNQVQ